MFSRAIPRILDGVEMVHCLHAWFMSRRGRTRASWPWHIHTHRPPPRTVGCELR